MVLDNGDILKASVYIAATGIKPNVGFLEDSGLELGWGVPVDAALATSLPDVWAAGDVAETTDRVTGERYVHAIWPNADPNANDNVASNQLQGHSGYIAECQVCHEPNDASLPLGNNGPHGMHPIGEAGQRFVDGGHENLAEGDIAACRACHGAGNRNSMQGTVLSVAKKDRRLNGQTIEAGTPIACTICHD